MKEKLVSVIIVNWNGLKWLPDCFNSLHTQQYKNFEIIFVDNASTDGSVSWIKKYFPRTKIVINKENLGFAGANNVGYKYAKGEYVLFLNNDTRVTRAFLTELVRVLSNDETIAGAQSKILLMDHPDTHDSVGAFLTPTGFLYHYGFGQKENIRYNKQIDLYTAKGACMMFKKSVLDEVLVRNSIFDPDYFAYFEESDMCHRVLLAGYKIVFAYKSVIYHKMGATSSGMNNAFIQYHSFKNRIRTYLKNLGPAKLLPLLFIHLAMCEVFSFATFIRGKVALSWAIQRAILWNMTHLSQTIRDRKYIHSTIRKVSDATYLPYVMKHPSFTYYVKLSQGKVSEAV